MSVLPKRNSRHDRRAWCGWSLYIIATSKLLGYPQSPHQREFCSEGLLGRHALGMLGRTLDLYYSYHSIDLFIVVITTPAVGWLSPNIPPPLVLVLLRGEVVSVQEWRWHFERKWTGKWDNEWMNEGEGGRGRGRGRVGGRGVLSHQEMLRRYNTAC